MSYEIWPRAILLAVQKKVLKINNGSKENRYAAAISWSGDTERREKNGDLFVIKKNLKYSCMYLYCTWESIWRRIYTKWMRNKEIHKKKYLDYL